MKPGDIVYAPMLLTEGGFKQRPILVLKTIPPFGDLLVCGITTRFRNYFSDLDEMIQKSDNDFISSGLEKDSMIRLGYLITYPKNLVGMSIGTISEVRLQRLLNRLSIFLAS